MTALSLVSADPVDSGVAGYLPVSPPAGRDTVLLVEDDPAVAALLIHIMRRHNLRALHAGDGEECLRLFERDPAAIGLVFMDCGLPDAHGGTLSQRLRAKAPGLPMLFTSGREQPGLMALLAADGPTAFLPKPFLPGDVMQQVRALLGARAGDHP